MRKNMYIKVKQKQKEVLLPMFKVICDLKDMKTRSK